MEIHATTIQSREQQAAMKIQGMFRVRMARKRLRLLLKAVVERFYDADSGTPLRPRYHLHDHLRPKVMLMSYVHLS